ncbi:D-glycero-alpha-D-manno-heptose-1,7-bisphosphate 7-phosphatase [Brassicibacter mesophilus]|uniref:D-glycero-alpha-D-manno-heptose-1,7-bisphosphate 7-phosphatase n=1 Tax=Brassicibacter mesophilus TaxID=745119 RepID=UPI003D245598
MKKAIFLDRDGVINDNKRHVNKPDDLVIYDSAKQGLDKLYRAGYDLYIVTNQGGVELGHLTEYNLDKIHEKLVNEINPYCEIKDIKYCPDFKRKSDCRKPKPGMILELAEEYNIDLKQSWMIGDMDTDVEAGIRAGCKTAKIGKINDSADINGDNLNDVAKKIIQLG